MYLPHFLGFLSLLLGCLAGKVFCVEDHKATLDTSCENGPKHILEYLIALPFHNFTFHIGYMLWKWALPFHN